MRLALPVFWGDLDPRRCDGCSPLPPVWLLPGSAGAGIAPASRARSGEAGPLRAGQPASASQDDPRAPSGKAGKLQISTAAASSVGRGLNSPRPAGTASRVGATQARSRRRGRARGSGASKRQDDLSGSSSVQEEVPPVIQGVWLAGGRARVSTGPSRRFSAQAS